MNVIELESISTPGFVVMYPVEVTITSLRWIVCDGRAVSRTTYSTLWAAIGTVYGGGDGSTTFNVPDLRGQFLQGWDEVRTYGASEPDSTARPVRGDITLDSSGAHTHSGTTGSAGGHYHHESYPAADGHNSAYGADNTGSNTSHYLAWAGGTGNRRANTNTTGAHSHSSVTTGSNGAHTHTITTGGDVDTRPRNFAMQYFISTGEI